MKVPPDWRHSWYRSFGIRSTQPASVDTQNRPMMEALGYTASDWQRLESDLRQLATTGDATINEHTQYGQKCEIHATLRGPSGRIVHVMTIWIVRLSEEAPRFITAFPGEK